jgi:hypothetical protein
MLKWLKLHLQMVACAENLSEKLEESNGRGPSVHRKF